MDNFIAQTQTRVVQPSGEEVFCTIGLFAPVQQPTGEFGCGVSLPDSPKIRMIYGEDSLQSITLALRYLADRIDALISRGWEFYLGNSGDRFPFETYFSYPERI